MAKRPKIPKSKVRTPGKGARSASDPDDTNGEKPVWSIAIFDHEGPWGRELCSVEDALWEHIFHKLRDYESMTWGEIYRDRDRNHEWRLAGSSRRLRIDLLNSASTTWTAFFASV